MNLVHIVGRRNHGKTTLIVALVEELSQQGIRVGTIKHTHHRHELDSPGKDSHRQRQAGALPAAVVTSELTAVYLRLPHDGDIYQRLEPLYEHCRLVLVEGNIEGAGPKVEVWRAALGTAPMCDEHSEIRALITDDPVAAPVPVWPRSDIVSVARKIMGYCPHPG